MCVAFPRLFVISSQKEAKVRDVSVMQEGVRRWNLVWRRHPFLWETNLVSTLVASIEGITLGNDEDDWAWTPEEGGSSRCVLPIECWSLYYF